MARIAMTGLEAGSLGIFSSTYNNPAISTVQARTGTYSLLIGNDKSATLALNGLYDELYGRICIYTTGNQGASGFLTLIDGGGAEHCNFARNPTTGFVEFRRGTSVLATGSIQIPQNAWTCLEWHVVIDDAGLVQTKVDGVADLNSSPVDCRAGGEAGARLLRIGRTASNTTLLGYYDDIAVNDTSGAVNNSWPGRGGIYGLLPNGAGTHTHRFYAKHGGQLSVCRRGASQHHGLCVQRDGGAHRYLRLWGPARWGVGAGRPVANTCLH